MSPARAASSPLTTYAGASRATSSRPKASGNRSRAHGARTPSLTWPAAAARGVLLPSALTMRVTRAWTMRLQVAARISADEAVVVSTSAAGECCWTFRKPDRFHT